ncbi:sulfatase [Chitinophaga sp. MM2321]|uniref:sulfatase family protein n=1 Tax=Chitinophaga sp. MM2321 TaxID=3137178 RepID=UPI0032D5B156
MLIKKLCWLSCICLLPFTTINAQQKAKKTAKPNVIFILADDMGYGDLSCYGNPLIKTPYLDKMAAEGFKSGSFMVPSPACTPARAALLTGRYPDKVRMGHVVGPGSKDGLADSIFTLGKMFRSNGYQTMMIGKWHLGDKPDTRPLSHGFDHYFGMMYSHDYQDPFVKTDTTLAVFYDNTRVIEKPDYSKLLQLYTDTAVAYIARTNRSKQPFFLYLPYPMPHAPVAANEAWKGHSVAGVYGDVIEELDNCVGRVMQQLKQLHLDENTIVVFTSDNGPWNNMPERMFGRDIVKPWDHGSTGPFRGGKANTYEGGHREPFLVWWPGHVPAGQLSTAPCIMNDMMPTLAAATGYTAPLPANLNGISMWAHISGKEAKMPERVLYYLNASGQLEAVRQGDWKLRIAKAATPETELFNLAWDISEKHNVAERFPDKVKTLQLLLEDYKSLQ